MPISNPLVNPARQTSSDDAESIEMSLDDSEMGARCLDPSSMMTEDVSDSDSDEHEWGKRDTGRH